MTILEEGVGGGRVEAEVSRSRSRGPEDGPKKEIGICRLSPSGENWIEPTGFGAGVWLALGWPGQRKGQGRHSLGDWLTGAGAGKCCIHALA